MLAGTGPEWSETRETNGAEVGGSYWKNHLFQFLFAGNHFNILQTREVIIGSGVLVGPLTFDLLSQLSCSYSEHTLMDIPQ